MTAEVNCPSRAEGLARMSAMHLPDDMPYVDDPATRRCPWCGQTDVRVVSRGYTGPTDEVDQYFTCRSCGETTYELVAKNGREMRMGRYRPGDLFREAQSEHRYRISRVLKVGLNEYLIYLQPIVTDQVLSRT